ncbi:MAG: exonuclease SbcCD subunit D [bacterium]
MRFLHTSDWHAGRIWKRVDRLDELRATLEHMVAYVAEHQVDVVLISGDVFDSRSPSGRAERLVAEIFRAIDRAGAKTVVIAGNHDSATRMDAWRILAELANVTIVATPRSASQGGVVTVSSRDGRESATIACIPFASSAIFLRASEMAEDETKSHMKYAQAFGGMVKALQTSFRPDTVNILMAHTHLEGAILANSERQVHVGENWAADVSVLPHDAHYVALGHIHKPQALDAACPAYYAGSPFQLDFGEVGELKTFNVFDARAGGAGPKPKLVPYQGAKPLKEMQGTLTEILDAAPDYQDAWVRVTVDLQAPDPDVARRVRAAIPGAVVVHANLPKKEAPKSHTAGLTHVEMYREWVSGQNHAFPDDMIREFERLYVEVKG